MTEQDYLDLAWRAHVGGLADRINLTMATLRFSDDGSLRQIVLAFSGITSAGMHMAKVMDRALRDTPVFISENLYKQAEATGMDMKGYDVVKPMEIDYRDAEARLMSISDDGLTHVYRKSVRVDAGPDDWPMPYDLANAPRDYTPHTYDYKRHNKTVTGRLRNYRGPPPQRFK